MYHSYVRKAIRVKIFQNLLTIDSGPFGLLLGHSYCFCRGARPSLNGPTCCPCLFRMLGFDRSCINLLFLIGWSPYSSWCSGTCKDWYLSLVGHTTRYPCDVTRSCLITCPAFQKSSSVILFSNVVFFDGPTTQARIC